MEKEFNVSKKVVIGLSVVAAVILFLVLCFRVVEVGKVGVLTSFGHVVGEAQSGPLLKAPWPFQKLSKFDIRTQKDQAEAAASSADLQDVKVTLVTNYHVDPNKVGELFRTVGTDYKKRIIDPAIQESIKATSAQFAVADLITKRPQLKSDALKNLRDRLASRGILVEDISITNLGFSAEFTQAIEKKQVAQQEAEQAAYSVQKAENDAKAAIAGANGRAESQRIMQDSLTPETLQRLAIDKWSGNLPLYWSGVGSPLNLPIQLAQPIK